MASQGKEEKAEKLFQCWSSDLKYMIAILISTVT